jgi:hypothetical protein
MLFRGIGRYLHTKRAHDGQRHFDVRPRYKRTFDVEFCRTAGGGAGHEKSAEELAGRVCANNRATTSQTVGVDKNGWATVFVLAYGVDTELPQRVEQIANRALAHPQATIQAKRTMSQTHQRRQESDCGTAIVTKKFRFQRWDPPAAAVNDQDSARFAHGHGNAQLLQASDHDSGVIAIQRADHSRTAISQRGTHQRPVGDALGAGRPNGGLDWSASRHDLIGQRHVIFVCGAWTLCCRYRSGGYDVTSLE